MEQPNQDNHFDYHSGSGIIIYDPFRAGMKGRTKWWCIVEVDKEITRYYRWWLQREKHIILQKPAWDAHISVIRGEHACSQHPEFWKKYQGQKIHFKYEHGNLCREADADGGFFYWIDVDCNFLNQVRAEFGLPRGWRFHLTIGRTYQYEARKPKGKA